LNRLGLLPSGYDRSMMKKTLILTALVAAPAALAAPKPTAVTITALPSIVTYGSPTTLTGTVTPPQSAKISIAAERCLNPPPRSAVSGALKVDSDASGTWRTIVTPSVQTTYQASVKNVKSSTQMVQVRPRVTLAKVARHKFRTRIAAAKSFGGKIALFQKKTLVGWKTVKSVVLVQVAAGPESVISGKTFRSGISRHRTVRILLTQRQVGNCYVTGISNSVRS
jgi:hypothetical protein